MDQKAFQLQQIIERIETFKGIDTTQMQSVLALCRSATYEAGEWVYTQGTPSEDMVVLLKGRLEVSSSSGESLGVITPGHSVGEMGLFSGRQRSANVTASVDSSGLVIEKKGILALFKQDPRIHLKVMPNALNMVCGRLVNSNVQIESFAKQIQTQPGEEVEEGEEAEE